MKRIGMTNDPADDFDHPLVDEGHLLNATCCGEWQLNDGVINAAILDLSGSSAARPPLGYALCLDR
jgi:hypothetical protein